MCRTSPLVIFMNGHFWRPTTSAKSISWVSTIVLGKKNLPPPPPSKVGQTEIFQTCLKDYLWTSSTMASTMPASSQCEDRWTGTVCTRLASAPPNELEPCTLPRQQHCINIVLPQRIFFSATVPILQGTTTSRQRSQTAALEGPTAALHTSRLGRNGAESP